ncbi:MULTISPECIES: NUDIX hydrolase [Paenibacillus]|uniref:NUDIX domain-containing protein n=1 Tax=Paenibacillus radicis (ex Xue et al. 2023) TaxID=2972489 RepID=A0ABT1YE26_9BACL|nr:NUDIX domain-containing protein [Paenibacillus radicis (ex Xue et al. 2023)]MCR8631441.1 NUDIX domain-containing protein [Paenibacillus radicis (ex Xue et al. 2023)]
MREISAGGVVYRKKQNELKIQMIQDRYGKITLPKGKMEPGETVEQTALREILEETGIVGTITKPLEVITYQFTLTGVGLVDKEVHYFLVEAKSGELQAQVEEIRGVEWLDPMNAWYQQKHSGYGNNDSVMKKALHSLGYEVN